MIDRLFICLIQFLWPQINMMDFTEKSSIWSYKNMHTLADRHAWVGHVCFFIYMNMVISCLNYLIINFFACITPFIVISIRFISCVSCGSFGDSNEDIFSLYSYNNNPGLVQIIQPVSMVEAGFEFKSLQSLSNTLTIIVP